MADVKILEACATQTGTYTDMTDYLTPGAFTVTPAQFAPNRAQSPLTGALYTGLVTTKRKIAATINPLTQSTAETILPLLSSEQIFVNYRDPVLGWRTGVKMASASTPGTALMLASQEYIWTDVQITLEEV